MIDRTVRVKIDESMHTRPPRDDQEELSWALLDTVYALYREYSVRSVFIDLRDAQVMEGVPVTSDEELVQTAWAGKDGTYADLAPHSERVGRALEAAWRTMATLTRQEAADAIDKTLGG